MGAGCALVKWSTPVDFVGVGVGADFKRGLDAGQGALQDGVFLLRPEEESST